MRSMIARMRASWRASRTSGRRSSRPIHTRSAQTQIDLTLIRAREVAVQTRTKIVNAVRGMVKSTGHRLPASPTLTFARKATEACPEALQPALLPLTPPGPDLDRRHCGVRSVGGGESARVSRDAGHSDDPRRRRADGCGLRAGAEQRSVSLQTESRCRVLSRAQAETTRLRDAIAAVGDYQSWRPVDAPARHAECAVHLGSLWAGLGPAPLGARPWRAAAERMRRSGRWWRWRASSWC